MAGVHKRIEIVGTTIYEKEGSVTPVSPRHPLSAEVHVPRERKIALATKGLVEKSDLERVANTNGRVSLCSEYLSNFAETFVLLGYIVE